MRADLRMPMLLEGGEVSIGVDVAEILPELPLELFKKIGLSELASLLAELEMIEVLLRPLVKAFTLALCCEPDDC